jgi:four helix bundle protein
MIKFKFQDLDVYKLAKNLAIDVYSTSGHFPADERYALVQQMNRAVISIPSNIAEGYSRISAKDKSHFLNMAYGSLMELICQYEISKELTYITNEQYEQFLVKAQELAVKISNLRKAIESNPDQHN